jgi:hypothetical protein
LRKYCLLKIQTTTYGTNAQRYQMENMHKRYPID